MNPYKKRKPPRYKGKYSREKYNRNSPREMNLMSNACFMVKRSSIMAFEETCEGYGIDANDVIESLMDDFVKDLMK